MSVYLDGLDRSYASTWLSGRCASVCDIHMYRIFRRLRAQSAALAASNTTDAALLMLHFSVVRCLCEARILKQREWGVESRDKLYSIVVAVPAYVSWQ